MELIYQKFMDAVVKTYLFEPYILKEYKSRWYVIGMETGSGKLKTFSLDRVESVTETGVKFKMSVKFDSAKYFEHSLGITVTDDAPEKIELEFSSEMAPYVLTQNLHPTQKILRSDNESLLISLDLIVTFEVINTILSFGENVKVLKPEHLKEKVKRTLSECLNSYD